MTVDWMFIDSNRRRSRRRLTPSREVRDIVVGEHLFEGEVVWWYYDEEKELAVISNNGQLPFVGFGRSVIDQNNSIVPDSVLIDVAFPEVNANDCIVFLGHEKSVNEDNFLYMIHEKQVYDLIPDESDIP